VECLLKVDGTTSFGQSSLPVAAQEDFIKAISLLWLPELRQFFQNKINKIPSNEM
jgi:hypothetical protein